jgi:hypothetical protein
MGAADSACQISPRMRTVPRPWKSASANGHLSQQFVDAVTTGRFARASPARPGP